jgi:PAB-dependent poly(A)-specific ribonuclease subunit 2
LCEQGVISIAAESVHLANRRGVTQWHLQGSDIADLNCMAFTSRDSSEIVVGSRQGVLLRIDVDKGTVLDVVRSTVPIPYNLMKLAGQHVGAATSDGSIYLLNPKTLTVVHSWKAYSGSVNDLDARGDYLVTCGWIHLPYTGLAPERLVRVYDLKNQKPGPLVAFLPGAAYVRLHPKLSSTCIVVSHSGSIHSIDIQNQDSPTMRYANVYDGQISGLELMPSGRGFALVENSLQLVLWGSSTKLQLTEYGKPADYADTPIPSKPLDWAVADAPLNKIGMPFYRETLFSAWSYNMIHEVGLPAPRIDSKDQHGKFVVNPRKTRRYEFDNTRTLPKSSDPMAAPKFLSEKPRDDESGPDADRRPSEDIGKALKTLSLDGSTNSDVKFLYRIVEIRYSKFGVEDFDFRYYNRTKYAGLETHIVNSYANPLLQILRFTPTARNLALHHTARDCRADDCLFCELGFLVDMLEKARSPNCQATNFLRALSHQRDAQAHRILEEHFNSAGSLGTMIQALNRFLYLRLEENFKYVSSTLDNYHLAFGTIGVELTRCTHCNYESQSEKVWYAHELIYPPKPPKHSPRPMPTFFSNVLSHSIKRNSAHRGWCLRCNGYKGLESRRAIHCLPAVLTLNVAANTPENKSLWATPGFLPKEIGVIVEGGRSYCYEGQDLKHHLQRRQHNMTVYELVGIVVEVNLGDNEKSHLVAAIDVSITDPDKSCQSSWHLFNDFLVHPIAAEEALHFNPQWKLPSIITYQIKTMSHVMDDSWKSAIDSRILYRSPIQPALSPNYQCRALSENEPLPGPESHCAIDAEFVRLLREEIDVGADGSRTMTRPARSGLARVSVLRGDGLDQELPFIDDYIAIDEHIDDYLTQYSGLKDGDLSIARSPYTLVRLKEVYKKLWVLLNLGCAFIGHGLSSDFRIINIHVPEAQVIDTQELFSLGSRGRRKLSLRFLAWAVLKEDIQHNAELGHDSIEDARTALKLWRKYLEYQHAGILETIIDEIWLKGRACNFVVPADHQRDIGSAPGTPNRQSVNLARMSTPRSDFASPLR